jgi:SAM-dependent methyltransferase
MTTDFSNVYSDPRRAEAYAKLEFPGTYYLAYRDLPEIIATHAGGPPLRGVGGPPFHGEFNALDFGCGAGRSTRFLKKLGFATIGVDISDDMLKLARTRDPEAEYMLVDDGSLRALHGHVFDLVLSAFTFDNIPTLEKKVSLFTELAGLLTPSGRIVSLVSSPEIYTHEWTSFTTRAFPENRSAKSGDKVRIIMTDVEDRRPAEDILWTDDAYRDVYARSQLELLETYRPLGKLTEPYKWVNETQIAPWVIYVLKTPGS